MSTDTGRERIDEERQPRRMAVRLTPDAKPGQTGELLSPSPSQESADRSQPTERNAPSSPQENAKEGARSISPLPTWLGRLRYYGLALLFVGVAVLLRWALWDMLTPTPFLVFYLAWVGAAAFGGLGPGLLATLASWWCIELLFDPAASHIGFHDVASIARLLVFLAGGLAVSLVGEKMRRSRIHERRQGRELAAANVALRASEEKYRLLVENSKDITWTVDLQGRWTFISSNMEKMTGYRADELIGKMLWDFLAPESRDRVKERLRRRLRGADLPPYEVMFVSKDGRHLPFEVLAASVVDVDGNIVGVQGVSRDITERKRAEEALRASEEKYRFLVENSKDVTWTIDLQGRCTFISSNVEQVAGYRVDEVLGRTLWDFLAPECHEFVKEKMRRRVRGEDLPPYEVTMVGKDGHRIPSEVLAASIVDDAGNTVGIQGVSRDITERKRAEEALRASEEKYRFLVENSKDVTWTMDLQGRWTFISGNVEKVAGYRVDEVIGKTLWDFLAPECHDLVKDKLRRRMHGEDLPPYEVLMVGKDGRRTPFEVHAVSIVDDRGNIVGLQGVSRDITERKRAEEALQFTQFAVDHTADAAFWMTEDAKLFYVNEAACQALGYSRAELLQMTVFDIDPAFTENLWRESWRRLRAEKNIVLETVHRARDGRIYPVEIRANYLEFGGRAYDCAFARDITERKRAEEALVESRRRYRGLVEKINDWVWEIDADGVYTYSSPRALELLGYAPEEIVGKTPFDLMPPAEAQRVWNAFRPIWLERKPLELLENTLVRKDGRLVTVETSGMPVFAEDGSFLGYTGIDRDVTSRKWAEEQLRRSEQDLNRAQAVAQTGSWRLNVRRNELLWSNETYRMFGIPRGTPMTYETFLAAVYPADREHVDRQWTAALRGEPYDIEHRILAEGTLKWVREKAELEFDEEGTLLGGFGTVQDITQRKQAEEALRASQSMLRSVMENVPQGIFWKDRHSTYLGCNNVFAQAAGLASARDIVGKTDYDLPWSPEQTASFREYDRRIMENDAPEYHIIEQQREVDGKLAWLETNKVPLHDAQGHVIGILGTYENITERKQAEEALRESEEKFRLLAETSPAAILIYQDGKYVYANPAAESITGYSCAELLPQAIEDIIHPDYRQKVKQMVSRRAQGPGPPVHYELKTLTKDGRERWMDSATASIMYGNKPAGLVVAFDITERKRAEEALRQEKTFTDKLFNAPLDTVFLFEPVTGKPVRWNKRFAEVSGYEDEEIAGMKAPDDFYDENDLKKAQECMGRILADGRGVVALSLITKQGVHIPFEYVTTVVEAEEGKTLFLSIGRDITERKRAEEALRESEERFRIMADGSPNPIWVTNAEGERIFANKQYLEYFGISEQETEGGEWKSFIHPDDAPTYVNSFLSSLKEHRPFSAEARGRRADGQWRWIESHAEPRLSIEGAFLGFVGITQDITKRKQAEQELREWNATLESRVAERTAELEHRARELQKLTLELTEAEERERKRLAEILHDDLQQVLAAAKFQVSLLDGRVRNDAESHEIAEQARDLLVDAIAKSRSLSHELSSPALSQSDLCETLMWLAEQMQKKQGLTVHLDMAERIELASEPLRVLLYKAAQEFLFNAIKHAGVHEAKLRLRHHRGRLWLSVSDQGRGFDPTEPGCNLGFGLLSIRERVGYLGGRMKIRSAVGKGSTFLITVPDAEVHAGK